MPTFHPSMTLGSAVELLRRHDLLREVIAGSHWSLDVATDADVPFSSITYDTRAIACGTLLCCKGRFKAEYLTDADGRGLAAYVAGRDYSAQCRAPGLIVNDERKAMSLLASEFYGHPQDELTVIGITGTKGKTTTAYLTHAILNEYSQGHAALFSSQANCLDGHTLSESELTTPESLDAFRMMREAVSDGMRYLVMEVSSQAYKVDRVYGLTFDVGAFLNISPDHISPIEHPTFEDYFYCKRRMAANSHALVLGADTLHASLIRQEAEAHGARVVSFGLTQASLDQSALNQTAARQSAASPANGPQNEENEETAQSVNVVATPDPHNDTGFSVTADGTPLGSLHGTFHLAMPGIFNQANAAAALALAIQAGVPATSKSLHAIETVQVPGRMQRFTSRDGIVAYVDFAHNYLSTRALIETVEHTYFRRNPRLILVSGSTGNKALDRREGIVKAALGHVSSFIFTLDDPNFEDPAAIAQEMSSYVTDPGAETHTVIPRDKAIEAAVRDARAHADRFNIILLIGKGDETHNVIGGEKTPYEGDGSILRRAMA